MATNFVKRILLVRYLAKVNSFYFLHSAVWLQFHKLYKQFAPFVGVGIAWVADNLVASVEPLTEYDGNLVAYML